ncbi:hypothetical protein [Herminiimonas fonticola]|uniref:Uncharacterized protein n=1 Tax=Herminiimonas fonticola TaxID=303380 RepID=A0A4R6G8A7_9BURK|nr:hypothetical protein [Herminiimonas fonticola]RBA24045.1 hypothetical protein Hfont_1857 [Herminiimonas fonticola]TDN90044.1 hypothetical protein EV677_2116 [Herminiimonas fonticola]
MNISVANLHEYPKSMPRFDFASAMQAHKAPTPEPIEEPLPGEHPVPQKDPVPSPNPEIDDRRS